MIISHIETIYPSSFPQEMLQPERLPAPFDLDHSARQGHESPIRPRSTKSGESLCETEIGSVRLIDPAEACAPQLRSKAQHIRDTDAAYAGRITVLEKQAALDGYSLNQASREAFFAFRKKNPLIRRGRLVLMENGNLRAVWKGENEAHIGLQFLNTRSIQYVIFTRRDPQSPVSRVSGRDTMDGIMKQIEAFDLNGVLYT